METLPRHGSVQVTTSATPEQVWDVLADVTRTGEWSHETHGAEWLDGTGPAVPGARFKGRNKHGRTGWTRLCRIEDADRGRRISWVTVPTRLYPDSTRWTYDLSSGDGGTTITQSFEVLKLSAFWDRVYALLIPAHRDRSAALAEDLRRLGEVAARAPIGLSG
jgi:hypothetical protein